MIDEISGIINVDDTSQVGVVFYMYKRNTTELVSTTNVNSNIINTVQITTSFDRMFKMCYLVIDSAMLIDYGIDPDKLISNPEKETKIDVSIIIGKQNIKQRFVPICIDKKSTSDSSAVVLYMFDEYYSLLSREDFMPTVKKWLDSDNGLNQSELTPSELVAKIFQNIKDEYNISTEIKLDKDLEYVETISDEYTRLTKNSVVSTADTDNANFLSVKGGNVAFKEIQRYCRLHNIKLYANWNTINIIQSLDYSKLYNYTEDKGITLSEVANKKDINYIYASKKYPNTDVVLKKIKYLNVSSKGGTNTSNALTDTQTFEKIIRISDGEIVSNWDSGESIDQTNSSDNNVCSAFYDLAKNYNKRQILIVYINALLDLNVGNLIKCYIQSDDSTQQKQLDGDFLYNGLWIVNAISISKINQKSLVTRIILHRYDVPIDYTNVNITPINNVNKTVDDISKEANNNSYDTANSNEPVVPDNMNIDLTDPTDTLNNLISNFNTSTNSFNSILENLNVFSNIHQALNSLGTMIGSFSNAISAIKNTVNSINDVFTQLKSFDKDYKIEIEKTLQDLKDTINFKDFSETNNFKFQFNALITQAKNINKEVHTLNNVMTNWNYTSTTEQMTADISEQVTANYTLINERTGQLYTSVDDDTFTLKANLKEKQKAQLEATRNELIKSGAIRV